MILLFRKPPLARAGLDSEAGAGDQEETQGVVEAQDTEAWGQAGLQG